MKTDYIKLEYDKILNILSNHCKTYIGKNLAINLEPVFDTNEVTILLAETTEARNLIAAIGNIPIDNLPNIELWIKYLESSKNLSCKSLLDISKILDLAELLKKYFYTDTNILTNYSILGNLFSKIYCNESVKSSIQSAVLDENTIDDKASKTLYSLRKNKRNLEQEIKSKLNTILHSSSYSKYIMEPIITIRNNRYVIPIKFEDKDKIHGFIHDISASGSTVFIEPTSVFELNSKINSINLKEELEIEQILAKLSALCVPIVENLKKLILTIGKIDFIFAKATFSIDIDGVSPKINTQKFLSLKNARHPLIDKTKVVPINISLGKKYNSLIITGPNTGGKTVTLKTVGLLTLMSCSRTSYFC